MTFGFIILRHVNSDETNKYWNQSVKLIRTLYPNTQIVIIDDNSNHLYLKSEREYMNITIVQSEFPKRGELLPFIYFLKYKWFDYAVIIHDGTFIHKRIRFETFRHPVLPLWHHPQDGDNISNSTRMVANLKNNSKIYNKLRRRNNVNILGMKTGADSGNLCFGCQCFINLRFLEMLESKYAITRLIKLVNCRTDRCTLERIFGFLFCEEFSGLKNNPSLFGEIFSHYKSFRYHYAEYINDFNEKKIVHPVVKVWTGR